MIKNLLFFAIIVIPVVGQTVTNYQLTVTQGANGVLLGGGQGITYGPADVGGRLQAQCVVSFSSYYAWNPDTDHYEYYPPHNETQSLDTGSNYYYIGIIVPGGTRGPCRVQVSYNWQQWRPTDNWDYENGGPTAPGIGAGVKWVDWTFQGVPYHRENWAIVYCGGAAVFSSFNLSSPGQCG
jgi:hypothetical protein